MSLAVPLLLSIAWAATLFIYSVYAMTAIASIPEEARIAAALVRALYDDASGRYRLPEADREAIEVALATKYRAALTSQHLVSDPFNLLGMTPRRLELAEERIARRLARADLASHQGNTALETLIKQAGSTSSAIPWYLGNNYRVLMLLRGLLYVAFFAHVNALVFRGGVIRLLGLEFVAADGQRASRLRVLSRTAAAWAPLLILASALVMTSREPAAVASSAAHWLTFPCLLLLSVGAVIAILRPERGIQDRLAGTWIVPR
jgi:hypothetical protein